MRVRTLAILTTIAAAGIAGCAATPASPASPTKSATTAKTAAADPGVEATPGGITPELSAKARGLGYRPRNVAGKTVFCRSETPLGTRFAKDVCVSPDRLGETVRAAELARAQMLRAPACSKDGCTGN